MFGRLHENLVDHKIYCCPAAQERQAFLGELAAWPNIAI